MNRILKRKLYGMLRIIPDKAYLRLMYFLHTKKWPNIDNPVTFNEKLQWLKLYDRNPLYPRIVDKYQVREYVKYVIGEKYLVPLIGVWDCAEDIDFNGFPEQFVLKCTHDSGSVLICKDKSSFDFQTARQQLSAYLQHNMYYGCREWPYKQLQPRVIAEAFLSDEIMDESKGLTDYKFMCFNGEPKCVFTATNRFKGSLNITFFDMQWNRLPFERHYPQDSGNVPVPECFEEMIEISRKLSKAFPFVRVDLYQSGGKIYFSELTLYPGGGFEEFRPDEWDTTLGQWIELPRASREQE